MFLISSGLNAQNLIINPSFEDTIPYNPWSSYAGLVDASPPWFTLNPSPDYLSESYYPTSIYPNGCLPQNFFGFQYARTGIACAGLATYFGNSPVTNLREIISYTLPQPLISGHTYYLEFYTSPADSMLYATDGMAAYFTVDTPSTIFAFNYIPQVSNPLGNLLNDNVNWTKISGSFIAQGGERVMTVGNLKKDSNTIIDTLYANASPLLDNSYYFLDDFYLVDSTILSSMEQIDNLSFSIAPNPFKDYLTITTHSEEPLNIYIFDNYGRNIFVSVIKNEINLNTTLFSKGIYFYICIKSDKIVSKGKLIKN